jgi:DNA-binding Xre family transcriptional regulator
MKNKQVHRDDFSVRESLCEERFLLKVQVEMQKLLNSRGLKYKDLAHRLGVSEARVSQLFGDDAKNLTIRTLAKVFYHLGETPMLTTASAFDRAIANAEGKALPTSGWQFVACTDLFDAGIGSEMVQEIDVSEGRRKRASVLDWASADGAQTTKVANA